MDVTVLEEIGLTTGEIKVYLALIEKGQSTTGPVAKKSGISHSKVYMILDKLEKKGLVSHVEKNNINYYLAEEPSRIRDYLDEKKKNIIVMEKRVEDLIPKLRTIRKKSDESEKVRFYRGLRGMASAHEHTYSKLGEGEYYCTYGITTKRSKKFNRYWVKDHKRRERAGIGCRLLFNRSTDKKILIDRNKMHLCEARYMPLPIEIPSWVTVYKDTILITMPVDDEPVENSITVEIQNAPIAESFQIYFDQFWKMAEEL